MGNRIEIPMQRGELIQEIAPIREVLFLALNNGFVYYVTPEAVVVEALLLIGFVFQADSPGEKREGMNMERILPLFF